MAGWISANIRSKPIFFEGIDKDKGFINISPKHGPNLMQNCDLPPPVKLLSGPDKAFLPSISIIYEQETLMEDQLTTWNEKWELLKALRLSQTRAREAEKRIKVLSEERDAVSNLLIEESSRLSAHRQWVKVMELQVVRLERQRRLEEEEEEEDYYCGMNWFSAVALCLAIAGVGFALACSHRYVF